MNPETLEWAQDAFRSHLDILLDDPYGFKGDKDAVPGIVQQYRRVAQDLGLDFDTLVAEIGTPYEIERLRKLEDEA